jgi:hypothetical protein
MPEKSKKMRTENNFEKTFVEMEDQQLKVVLKKRNLYQKEAAQVAIREALRRNLIESEEDLYAPEFRHEPLRPRLFPKIEKQVNRNKIRKSVARGLFLAGLLPAIWGMVRINAGFSGEGSLLFGFGLVWMGSAAWLIRQYSGVALKVLFALTVISVVYVGRWFAMAKSILFMDVFIVIVLYSLAVYGLFFIPRLK